ncbi:MAG: biotin--[acetyl-CoA-carboxylase] ligase [Planctomycetota bacterium]
MIEWQLIKFETLASTNKKALEIIDSTAAEGTVIIAECQTGGHGRFGRKWYSLRGESLSFSVILYPPCIDKQLFLLPVLTGNALTAAIKKISGVNALLKWPNDVLINNKKVCGVLIETKQINERFAAVIGIGINVNNNQFPENIADKATSIKLECGKEVSTDDLLNTCLEEISQRYKNFISGKYDSIVQEAKQHSALIGKKVKIVSADKEIFGKAVDMDEVGALIVKLNSGTIQKFTTGEINMVREAANE